MEALTAVVAVCVCVCFSLCRNVPASLLQKDGELFATQLRLLREALFAILKNKVQPPAPDERTNPRGRSA